MKQDENLLGQPIFQNPGVPVPSNEMGNAKPVFNPNQAANAQYVFGTPDQRAKSMPQREITPLYMEDLSGDGKITQKDIGIAQGWIKPEKKINLKNKDMDNVKNKASGQNAIWDGPLNLESLPQGKGSSSGKNG